MMRPKRDYAAGLLKGPQTVLSLWIYHCRVQQKQKPMSNT
jgi:hypothetical protein